MELQSILNELFGSDVYPVNVTEDKRFPSNGQSIRILRYEFTTKDNVEYRVMVQIWKKDRVGKLDFMTHSKNPEHSSIIQLINTHDAIKVFNTLKSIIENHRKEFDSLQIESSPDRIPFYEKLLKYFHVNYKKIGSDYLLATF